MREMAEYRGKQIKISLRSALFCSLFDSADISNPAYLQSLPTTSCTIIDSPLRNFLKSFLKTSGFIHTPVLIKPLIQIRLFHKTFRKSRVKDLIREINPQIPYNPSPLTHNQDSTTPAAGWLRPMGQRTWTKAMTKLNPESVIVPEAKTPELCDSLPSALSR
ncbi:hypothetical protein Ddc_15839 [Ditylenchus destructor]|nr:hypothetical protein Ddc_15839 [Ditylenchus destructor]